jgi:hypothetical protein
MEEINGDVRGMETHNLPPNAAQLRPIALSAHTAAIHDDFRIGANTIRDKRLPVALDPLA